MKTILSCDGLCILEGALTSGRTSFPSHEEGIPQIAAHPIPRSRHWSRRRRARTIRIGFYVLLVLLNFAVLSLFGPGGIAGDLFRLLEDAGPKAGMASGVPASAVAPDQYPPGENWDTGAGSTAQSVSRSR